MTHETTESSGTGTGISEYAWNSDAKSLNHSFPDIYNINRSKSEYKFNSASDITKYDPLTNWHVYV